MALTQDSIPNFIGGVSQQPDKLMYQNTAKTLVNYIPSATQGLIKRPPTEHKALLTANTLNTYPKTHIINHEDGQYLVMLDGSNAPKVWDMNGNAKTVSTEVLAQGSIQSDAYGLFELITEDGTYRAYTPKIGYEGQVFVGEEAYASLNYRYKGYARAIEPTIYPGMYISYNQTKITNLTSPLVYTGQYHKFEYRTILSTASYFDLESWTIQGYYTENSIRYNLYFVHDTGIPPTGQNEDRQVSDAYYGAYQINSQTGGLMAIQEETTWFEFLPQGSTSEDESDFKFYIDANSVDGYVEEVYEAFSTNNNASAVEGTIRLIHKESVAFDSYSYVDNPSAYIQAQNPLTQLDMTTIGSHTFILNKTKTVEMLEDIPLNPYKNAALIFVKQADYAITYSVTIDGKTASYTTSSSDITKVKTDLVRQNLVTNLKNKLGKSTWQNTYTIKEQGSCFVIYKNDHSEMSVTVTDSNGNRSLYGFYNTADSLENLPLVAPNSFTLKLLGEGASTDDDYYVKFETADGTEFSNGNWSECPSPDIPYMLDWSTMPHALVREVDSEGNVYFVFKAVEWTNRRAGDEESAKTPSFVGNTIQEVFAHKGRIGFLSNDKSIYSDTEDVFSFFKKTTLTKLDTDPIDLGSNSRLALLKHSLQYNADLLLFSPTSIFKIEGGDVFSNSTVTMDMVMEYPCSPVCKPIAIGDNGLYVANRGDFSTVYEIYLDAYANVNSRQLTEALPTYLPKNIFKIAGNVQNNMACFLSTETPHKIYVYNFYYQQEQKAQSAWCEWNFGDGVVFYANFIDSYLYLVKQYEDGIYLDVMNCSPKQTDDGLNFKVCLDRRVKVTNGTYDSEEDTTTYTIPYDVSEDIAIVDTNGFSHAYETDDGALITQGDTGTVYIGELYTSLWELPPIYKKQQTQSGSQKTVEGLLMIKDITLCYSATGYFRVRITPHYTSLINSIFDFNSVKVLTDEEQDSTNFNYAVPTLTVQAGGDGSEFDNQNNMLGTPTATLGEVSVHDGTMLIPVMMKNEEVTIEVINDSYLPCCFNSLVWLGNLCIRGQKS